MDPNVALAIIRDNDQPIRDRLAALNGLSGWLQMGGFVPEGIDAVTIINIDSAVSTLIERLGAEHDITLVAGTRLLNTI
jgi:hypothetical protein